MIKIAHLSDTHIGYEAYKAVSGSGENQRSVDFAQAFVQVVDEIITSDPDIVIHAGDVADRTQIPVRLMLLIRQQFSRLAGIRPNGTRRQLVVIAGNHEIPRNKKEACFLELFKGLSGVHIYTKDYEVLKFNNENIYAENYPKVLDNLAIHCLPHDALKYVDFDDVKPVKNMKNILVSHGVAGGSELYVRSLGREFAIPTTVLARDWDYGALGHWHKQGPIDILSVGGAKQNNVSRVKQLSSHRHVERDEEGFTPGVDYLLPQATDQGKIWYSGSTENSGFGDLMDNGIKRGWLLVTLPKFTEAKIERKYTSIRTMFRLPDFDATTKTPDEITKGLIEALKDSNTFGAVIGQIVNNVTSDTWSLVDIAKIRRHASQAMHYELTVRYKNMKLNSTGSILNDTSLHIDDLLKISAERLLTEENREVAISLSQKTLKNIFDKYDTITNESSSINSEVPEAKL